MELEEVLEQCLGQNFVHMIISNPKKGDFAGFRKRGFGDTG